jgi:acetyltransferase-like isoleucine patch superfamily enzyme
MNSKAHDDLVQFLQDTCRLDELLKADAPDPVLYDPVLITRRDVVVIGAGSRIDSFVKIEGGKGVRIGRYVHIASFAHIGIGGGVVEIGDYAAVASGGRIISGSNQVDAISMSACAPRDMQRVISYKTVLDRYSVVLAGATVLPGRTLHEGAVLAAGSVLTKDIPAWEIWGGIPAQFIRKRDLK